jgi:predicted RNA-binding protein with PUA-like domain
VKEDGMAYWLMKQEPSEWGWDDLVAEGQSYWDGVRNHQAAANIAKMKKGDKAFFYHSVDEKRIVGIMKVVSAPYPDPTAEEGSKWVVVDVKPDKPVKSPVTLADIKADDRFAEFGLVRQSRLSVVPVSDEHWAMLCEMGGVKP